MASLAVRMALAVRQVDSELTAVLGRYPQVLSVTHLAAIEGRKPGLRRVGGLLCAFTEPEFFRLSPLQRQLESNRCEAEAMLAMVRAGVLAADNAETEELTERALGILPTAEGNRLLEVASCLETSPQQMTGTTERFLRGYEMVEQEAGPATALGYAFLLMAGVRSSDDLYKYGQRLEGLFQAITEVPGVIDRLGLMAANGVDSLGPDGRARIARAVRSMLWEANPDRSGEPFLLTQVIDGYMGFRQGGVGDDLGLAVVDAIMAGKLGFEVRFSLRQGRVCVEVVVGGDRCEIWDPLQRNGGTAGPGQRLSTVDLLVMGYLRLARGYANSSSFGHGARVARWVVGLKPDCADAQVILGQCLLGQGKPKPALEACARALEIDSKLADAYLVQGNAHGVLGRWAEAVDRYKLAIKNRVGFAEAYNNLALALAQLGKFDPAVGAYNEATRVRPDYAEAYYNLGNLYLERTQLSPSETSPADYDEAMKAYQEAVRIAPDMAAAHYNLGQARYGKHDLNGALAAYQAAVKANPKHAGAWHNMGIVLRDLGRQQDAVEAIEKAVRLNPILLR